MTKVGVTSSKNIWQDSKTKLIWQNDGNYPRKNWKDAKKYCKNLTLDGIDSWRLPSRDELKTILTKKKITNSKGDSHGIKKELVEKMPAFGVFWSSTSKDDNRAWIGITSKGSVRYYPKSYGYYVSCIRGK
jgi:hypothetical protein